MAIFDYTWWYYIDKYLPYMYGLLIIEFESEKNDIEDNKTIKKEFLEFAINYYEEYHYLYDKKDLELLLNYSMFDEFGELILHKSSMYETDDCFKCFSIKASKLVKESKNNTSNARTLKNVNNKI